MATQRSSAASGRGRSAAGRVHLTGGTALLAGAALFVTVMMAAAGCGSSSGGSAPSLEGTAWKLTGWSETGQNPADFTITAQFVDGRIGGTSAVNSYGGPYKTGDDGSFSVGELVSTMMAGPDPDMRAEQTYMGLLPKAKEYAVSGDTLKLCDESGKVLLTYAKTASPSPGG